MGTKAAAAEAAVDAVAVDAVAAADDVAPRWPWRPARNSRWQARKCRTQPER
jgi:hypothetical protein